MERITQEQTNKIIEEDKKEIIQNKDSITTIYKKELANGESTSSTIVQNKDGIFFNP